MARLSMLGPRIAAADLRTAKPAPKTVLPFYETPEWRALIAQIVHQRGRRCEDPACKTPGRTGIRVFGDHIKEIQDGGLLLDPSNVLLRCGSCHTLKGNRERAKRTAATFG